MKKSILITLFAIVLSGAAFGQSAYEKSKVVQREEVPAAVMQAFEKDFASVEKGTWKLYYSEKFDGSKTTFTPEHYTFTGKKDGEKIHLTYSTAGVLEDSKDSSRGKK